MKPLYLAIRLSFFLLLLSFALPDWGFYGHRLINRKAVFTLPPEMIVFYKHHIDYLTDHAVDPDKRRYATRHEAVRHYMDLDQWGHSPFPDLPRRWTDALARHSELHLILAQDTLALVDSLLPFRKRDTLMLFLPSPLPDSLTLPYPAYRRFFVQHILPQYYEEQWTAPADSLWQILELPSDSLRGGTLLVADRFSEHGILPYHLLRMQQKLTEAFRQKSPAAILRLSADFGHYLGDAHVPLHTTRNYNGQLTGQLGIHAFWESRLPELYAEREYDFLVGRARYIEKPEAYFWDIVLSSHRLVDSVLAIEKRLSRQFPEEQQYCYDERLGRVVRTQCRDYARAYHEALKGQVEQRMRQAVHAIGSAWYTAWVDAGQPELNALLSQDLTANGQVEEREEIFREKEKVRRRTHED